MKSRFFIFLVILCSAGAFTAGAEDLVFSSLVSGIQASNNGTRVNLRWTDSNSPYASGNVFIYRARQPFKDNVDHSADKIGEVKHGIQSFADYAPGPGKWYYLASASQNGETFDTVIPGKNAIEVVIGDGSLATEASPSGPPEKPLKQPKGGTGLQLEIQSFSLPEVELMVQSEESAPPAAAQSKVPAPPKSKAIETANETPKTEETAETQSSAPALPRRQVIAAPQSNVIAVIQGNASAPPKNKVPPLPQSKAPAATQTEAPAPAQNISPAAPQSAATAAPQSITPTPPPQSVAPLPTPHSVAPAAPQSITPTPQSAVLAPPPQNAPPPSQSVAPAAPQSIAPLPPSSAVSAAPQSVAPTPPPQSAPPTQSAAPVAPQSKAPTAAPQSAPPTQSAAPTPPPQTEVVIAPQSEVIEEVRIEVAEPKQPKAADKTKKQEAPAEIIESDTVYLNNRAIKRKKRPMPLDDYPVLEQDTEGNVYSGPAEDNLPDGISETLEKDVIANVYTGPAADTSADKPVKTVKPVTAAKPKAVKPVTAAKPKAEKPVNAAKPQATAAPAATAAKPQAAPAVNVYAEVLSKCSPSINAQKAKVYQVAKGDTLLSIAKKFYGDDKGAYFPLIALASANLMSGSTELSVGHYIIIPDIDTNISASKNKKAVRKYFQDTAARYQKKETSTLAKSILSAADNWK